MILPDCYVRNLRMVNLNIPATKGGNLHILLERLKMKRNQDLPLLHDRMRVRQIFFCVDYLLLLFLE